MRGSVFLDTNVLIYAVTPADPQKQIAAAALAAKCVTLYTEDLQHGQQMESVRILNPFV